MPRSILDRKRNGINWLNYMPVVGMIVIAVFFSLGSPYFLGVRNLQNLSQQMAILLICAIGETIVILMGCIDLSVAGVIHLAGVSSALLLPHVGSFFAILLGIGIGAGCGLINGVVYQFLKIPSLIVTLAMSAMGTGLALILCNATPVPAHVVAFRYIARNQFAGIPLLWIVAAAVLAAAYLIQEKTRFGRFVYAIGGREEVVSLYRIPVRMMKILVYTAAGGLYGLGGVLLTGRMGTGTATMGYGWELDAIAAVVLGGTSISGGMGGVHRAFIGVFITVALANGLNLMGVSVYMQTAIKGLVLIIAVAFTMDRTKFAIVK